MSIVFVKNLGNYPTGLTCPTLLLELRHRHSNKRRDEASSIQVKKYSAFFASILSLRKNKNQQT